MIVSDRMISASESEATLAGIRSAYEAMMPRDVPAELSRVLSGLDRPDARSHRGARLALVVGADDEVRARAGALLEETSLGVVECASAEAALAVLVNEAGRTVFLLAAEPLAGPRDVEALSSSVRMLWPKVSVAISCGGADTPCLTDRNGVARLGRPWCGLDVLVHAERALSRAA